MCTAYLVETSNSLNTISYNNVLVTDLKAFEPPKSSQFVDDKNRNSL